MSQYNEIKNLYLLSFEGYFHLYFLNFHKIWWCNKDQQKLNYNEHDTYLGGIIDPFP